MHAIVDIRERIGHSDRTEHLAGRADGYGDVEKFSSKGA
jgi:hypothetical protein